MSDHYDELGVEPTATKDEIRDAHRARLAELESARSRKGVTDAQLQRNRDEAARVRGAWNVLSDPMQRQRYDQQLMDERAGNGDDAADVELVDDGSPAAPTPTGWRKLIAPPPAASGAKAGSGGKAGSGAKGAAAREPRHPSNRNRPEPTVVLPDGMHLAETKSRGMALAFDLAVCVIIYTAVLFVVPGLVKSGYSDIVDRSQKITDVKDAQQSVIDAKSTKDKNAATKDLQKAETAAKKAGVTPAEASTPKKRVDALDKQATKLNDSVRSALLVANVTIAALALLYLVPLTAIKGYTLGMKNRRIKVVRVNGARCGWLPAFSRFLVPVVLAIAIPQLGALLGLAMVLWGFRDRNGQGVHDKLARTLVVDA
jgi:curved DNA-binding protein CbpA